MTMRKIIAIIIVASILSGCGANAAPSKPETAVEADTSEAAQADTAPNQTTVVVWLDKGDVIVIEDARYVPSDGRETLTALEASVRSMKQENILGREIREADEGTIFFYAFDPDDRPVSYDGVLKLKLKGNDTWIDVNVRLN